MTVTPSALPATWRTRAAELERYAPAAAEAFRTAADELEDVLRRVEDALVSPGPASEVSLSKRRLRELEAEGKLKNYGKKGAPLYRLGDLPRRTKVGAGGFDASEHVAEIMGAGVS